jgi:hypothetical protein
MVFAVMAGPLEYVSAVLGRPHGSVRFWTTLTLMPIHQQWILST